MPELDDILAALALVSVTVGVGLVVAALVSPVVGLGAALVALGTLAAAGFELLRRAQLRPVGARPPQ